MSELPKRIFVAGHNGMVGSAVCRRLENEPEVTILTANRSNLDLCDQHSVHRFFQEECPDGVIFCAAKVGGIVANNSYPFEFLSENVRMEVASISASRDFGIQRFLFLGSTCIYPRDCPQPIVEDSLLSGPLEHTNEAYSLAKIVGLKLCQYVRAQSGLIYHSAMPTNLYGPGDNYHPEHSHVLPALIRRFHHAKKTNVPDVTIWGTGAPRREFLHVDDLADALVFLMRVDAPPNIVNVGTGRDATILEIAKSVAGVVGFEGKILTDPSRPDGTPRKVTDTTRLTQLGWTSSIDFEAGLRQTYEDFLAELETDSLRSV